MIPFIGNSKTTTEIQPTSCCPRLRWGNWLQRKTRQFGKVGNESILYVDYRSIYKSAHTLSILIDLYFRWVNFIVC